MPSNDETLRGVVHGNVIQFESGLGLPDGQEVTVFVRPFASKQAVTGEGIRRSAGAWSDDPEGLDQYLEMNRLARRHDRPGIES